MLLIISRQQARPADPGFHASIVSKRALSTATNAVGVIMQLAMEKASLNEAASKEGAERVSARLELFAIFYLYFK